jgi:hypothetical protein
MFLHDGSYFLLALYNFNIVVVITNKVGERYSYWQGLTYLLNNAFVKIEIKDGVRLGYKYLLAYI